MGTMDHYCGGIVYALDSPVYAQHGACAGDISMEARGSRLFPLHGDIPWSHFEAMLGQPFFHG